MHVPLVRGDGYNLLHGQERAYSLPFQDSLRDLPLIPSEASDPVEQRNFFLLLQERAVAGSSEIVGIALDRTGQQRRIPVELRYQMHAVP